MWSRTKNPRTRLCLSCLKVRRCPFQMCIRDSTELADAVSETRTAADQAAQLSEDGEAGLLRLTEIWCAMNGVPAVIIFEGSQSELLANVVAQIYAHLLQHPFHDPVGLAVYVELRYMTDALMLGEWFE